MLFLRALELNGLSGTILPSASGALPSSIANLKLWYKADSFALSDGATTTTWADQSGNSNTATVAAGTATYHTNQINGLPAITLDSSCYFTFASAISPSTGEETVFVVFNKATTSKGHFLGSSTSNFAFWASTTLGVDAQQIAQIGHGTSTLSSSTWYQANILSSGPGSGPGFQLAFRLNRATDTANVDNSTRNCTPPTGMGANLSSITEKLNGQLAELILYNRNLTGTEITTVETYLHTRYGL